MSRIVERDIVIENYRAGAHDRFGLDAASVRARNPRAVSCSITGFGSAGEGAVMGVLAALRCRDARRHRQRHR